jgi:hypothetical protein
VPNPPDLQSLFDKKQKVCEVLEEKNATLTFDLVRERIKIQVDIAKVYERVTMSAAVNAAVTNENSYTRVNGFAVPDDVVSSSHNTITPSPGGRNSGRKSCLLATFLLPLSAVGST